jgi:citrate synthase
VVVADTEVGDVRGSEGFYHYRQFSAVELAERRPIEDVWRLMIDGALPDNPEERAAFIAEVAPLRAITPSVLAVLPAIAAVSEPLDGLRTALSLARRTRPAATHRHRPDERRRLQFVCDHPHALCALHRLRRGRVVPPCRTGPRQYLWMSSASSPLPHTLGQSSSNWSAPSITASTRPFTGRAVADGRRPRRMRGGRHRLAEWATTR